jgi:hypothetical protein
MRELLLTALLQRRVDLTNAAITATELAISQEIVVLSVEIVVLYQNPVHLVVVEETIVDLYLVIVTGETTGVDLPVEVAGIVVTGIVADLVLQEIGGAEEIAEAHHLDAADRAEVARGIGAVSRVDLLMLFRSRPRQS